MAEIYYPGIAAGDSAAILETGEVRAVVTPNALYRVYELTDRSKTTPLPILTSSKLPSGPTGYEVPVGALPIFPDVYVVSPNYSHLWVCADLEFRRDSQDAKDLAVAAAMVAARDSAASAADAVREAAAAAVRPTDEAVTKVITTAGSAANTALSATIAEQIASSSASGDSALVRLNGIAASDREYSATESRIAFDSAPGWVENWANLNAWTTNGNVMVTDGMLNNNGTGGISGAYRPINASNGGRVFGSINVTTSLTATNAYTLIGLNANTTEPTSQMGNFQKGIGVRGDAIPVFYNAGAVTQLGAALPPGKYFVSITINGTDVSYTLSNTDGSVFRQASLTGYTPTNVIVWNTNRLTTEHTVDELGWRQGRPYVGLTANTVGAATKWSRLAIGSGRSPATVAVPAGYDPRRPTPIMIYSHGHTEADDYLALGRNAAHFGITAKAFLDAGYIVAASEQGGPSEWGNEKTQAGLIDLYRHLRESYNIGPIVLVGHSMGALAALTALARRTLPGVVGLILISPVVDLDKIFTGSYMPTIRTAYGLANDGEFAGKTAGYNPMARDPKEFRALPIHAIYSETDVSVPPTNHVIPFLAKLPASYDKTVSIFTGGHGTSAGFTAAAAPAVAFANRIIRG